MTTPPETCFTFEQVELCEATRARMIDAGPDHFDMAHWVGVSNVIDDSAIIHDALDVIRDLIDNESSWSTFTALNREGERIITTCGTTACLAGFAAIAGAKSDRTHEVTSIAQQLGMYVRFEDYETSVYRASAWFYPGQWPRWVQDYLCSRVGAGWDSDMREYMETSLRTRNRLEWAVVVRVLDEIVEGTRLDWYHEPIDTDEFDHGIEVLLDLADIGA